MEGELGTIRATVNFLLYDWLQVERLSERERFAEHGAETYPAVLDLCERIAAERFAPFNRRVDVEEPVFDGERVRLPACTEEACRVLTREAPPLTSTMESSRPRVGRGDEVDEVARRRQHRQHRIDRGLAS